MKLFMQKTLIVMLAVIIMSLFVKGIIQVGDTTITQETSKNYNGYFSIDDEQYLSQYGVYEQSSLIVGTNIYHNGAYKIEIIYNDTTLQEIMYFQQIKTAVYYIYNTSNVIVNSGFQSGLLRFGFIANTVYMSSTINLDSTNNYRFVIWILGKTNYEVQP